MKVSDYIVDFLEKQGLTDVFMVTGGGCMHLVNSFGNSRKIKYWCTQHEQAAAMAAEGYAKLKNNLCAVLTTSGPGATNTITGVLDCFQDSTPVIFISGQAKSRQTVFNADIPGLRQFGVQEANIVPIVQSITKMAVEINDSRKIRYYLEKAVWTAKSGRPGPVWLSIPLDIQSANVDPKELEGFSSDEVEKRSPSDREIQYVLDTLEHAERPVIIGGHGVRLSGACELLDELVTKLQIPVVTPFMGIDILPGNHACNIGRVGTKGTRAGNFTMQNADVIISIGSRLSVSVVGHEYELFAREAKRIAVDISREEHLKQTIELDKMICCDAKQFISMLLKKADHLHVHTKWLDVCKHWKEKYPVIIDAYSDDSNGINYYKFIDILNHDVSANMPVVSDAGSAFYVVAQAIDLKPGQRHITTGGTATMGFSLPAAIGVAAAEPASTVLAITGDGSFMQNMQELEVLRFHNMNVKVFIMNNGGYFSIHQTQQKFFDGNFVGESGKSGISFPDMKKVAAAFNIKYYKLSTIMESEKNLPEILKTKGPAIIEVIVTPDMEVIPTNASSMRADGSLVSKPLEDMYPFLDRNEFLDNMMVEPVNAD